MFVVGVMVGVQVQEIYILLILKGFQYQFWQVVKLGVMQVVKDYKVKVMFEGLEIEVMVDKQIDMLLVVIVKKLVVFGFVVFDSKVVLLFLKKVQVEKILVIVFDLGVDSDILVMMVVINNKVVVVFVVDKFVVLIGDEGEVVVVVYDQMSCIGIDCCDGFFEWMKFVYLKVQVVIVQYGEGDQLKLIEVMKLILQVYLKFKGLFGINEGLVIGVVNGVCEMKCKVVIIGYDFGKQQKDVICSGLMVGVIMQNLIGIGYKIVEVVVKVIKGEKLLKVIDIGFYWYDKINIDDLKIMVVLYD